MQPAQFGAWLARAGWIEAAKHHPLRREASMTARAWLLAILAALIAHAEGVE